MPITRKRWTIESSTNATFKRLKTLLTGKGIRAEKECLLSGNKLVLEKAKTGSGVKALIFPSSFDLKGPAGSELLHALSSQKNEWFEIEIGTTIFRELDELGTHQPILLLDAPDIPVFETLGAKPKGVELVCPFGDPQNLGAVARSAKAFGVTHMILTQETANPFLPKSLKASAGALLDIRISKSPLNLRDTMDGLSSQPLFGLDLEGEDMTQWKAPKDLYLALGEEGQGLPHVAGLTRISIPTNGVESLNAAVASSLAIFHLRA